MKVTLIRTGGTIGCLKGDDGVIALSPATDIHLDGFDLDVQTPFYELSERIGVSHYDKLVKAVLSAAADSEAIIITHGSDTLPYTASVLAFALGKTNIPIVFVCSDKPLTEKDASGHRSLKTAAAFIKTRESGVFVSDGNDVHFGVRLLEDRAFEERFFSAHDRICAHVDNMRVDIIEHIESNEKYPPQTVLRPKKILYIKPHPQIDYAAYDLKGFDCILHDTYHSGTADERKLNKFAESCRCPIYLVGGDGGRVYSSKAGFAKENCVIDNITAAALYCKLLVGLNRFGTCEELNRYLYEKQCGEFLA